MKIIEPGHIYELESIDIHGVPPENKLVFVNRETGKEHPGTQVQEVLRALIDRVLYCDACLPWEGNKEIVKHLRLALVLHEARALVRKVEKGKIEPEKIATDLLDGHYQISTKRF